MHWKSHFQRMHRLMPLPFHPGSRCPCYLNVTLPTLREPVFVTPSGAGKVRRSPRHLSPTRPNEANGHGCNIEILHSINLTFLFASYPASQTLECSALTQSFAATEDSPSFPLYGRRQGGNGGCGEWTAGRTYLHILRNNTFFLPLVHVFVPAQGRQGRAG